MVYITIQHSPPPHSHTLSVYTVKQTMSGFQYNLLPLFCGDIGCREKRIDQFWPEIRPQSTFTASRDPLPDATLSPGWSSQVLKSSYRLWWPFVILLFEFEFATIVRPRFMTPAANKNRWFSPAARPLMLALGQHRSAQRIYNGDYFW